MQGGVKQRGAFLPSVCSKLGDAPVLKSCVFLKNEENQSQEGWGQTPLPGTECAKRGLTDCSALRLRPRVKEVRTVTAGLGRGVVLEGGEAGISVFQANVHALGREKK